MMDETPLVTLNEAITLTKHPVQAILDRMTFKPFWWFEVEESYSTTSESRWLHCRHLTVNSKTPFSIDKIMNFIQAWNEFGISMYPVGRGSLHIETSNPEAARIMEIEVEGWTVIDLRYPLSEPFWTEEGIARVIRHLMVEIAGHEFDEFTRIDGTLINEPHPNGNSFPIRVLDPPPLPEKVRPGRWARRNSSKHSKETEQDPQSLWASPAR